MADVDLTVEICGMSGDGTIAAGGLLNAAMSRADFSVMAFDSYPAEIRGFGRCVTRCRFGDHEMLALQDRTHVLISLDDEQSLSRVDSLSSDATVFFDSRPQAMVPEGQSLAAHIQPGIGLVGVPFGDLAASAAGTRRGRNLAALGSFAAFYGMSPEPFHQVITNKFKLKGEKVLSGNIKSFDAAYEYVREEFRPRLSDLFISVKDNGTPEKILLSGNVAIGRGAMDAQLKLYFGYPITPATPIMEYLAKTLPEKGGKVLQMEDEIASIGAVLGSYFAGTRAMTATSGPGFALMTELITYGVMSETPAVIINAQRGGTSTGLPTKTEQSDLHSAVFGGPGDSARIVLAPTNVTECYAYTLKSFQLAEKYQTPVVVLTDFFLNNRVETVELPEISDHDVADANVYPDRGVKDNYHRFEVTDSGISSRALPGTDGYIFTTTGLEHSSKGNPDYSPNTHTTMTEKRHRKIYTALQDLPVPEEYSNEGSLDIGVVAWGSTFGSALEAVEMAWGKDIKAGALKITSLSPFHGDLIRAFMGKCKIVLIPELNYEGQLANLISHLYSGEVVRLNRVTGQPISPSVIYEEIETLLKGEIDR